MNKIKTWMTIIISALMDWLGILAVPVALLVGCNILDYITGLMAAPYRKEEVKSYKSIRGITKKVSMWLLVVVGAWVDTLIQYAANTAGIADIQIPFIVATLVAVWLVVNEFISILENLIDIGVQMPPFLMPIVKYIKKQVEDSAVLQGENSDNQKKNKE